MKKNFLLSLLAMLLPISVLADVWQDPATKVNYEYTVGGSTAKVMAGATTTAGSPDATGSIDILSKITVDGHEYAVTNIASYAFYGNEAITSVSVPRGITHIGQSAFRKCKNLVQATLSASVDSIDMSAFSNCESLSSVVFPQKMSFIGSWAFYGCSSLNNVTLPSTLEYISSDAFGNTPWYDTRYAAAADGLFYIDNILFGVKGQYPTGTVTIKEGTKVIASASLRQCVDITAVNFPSSLKSIGGSAFGYCNITSIEIPAGVTYIGNSAFNSTVTSVHIKDITAWCGIRFAYSNYVGDAKFYLNGKEITDLVIPDGVSAIGNYTFAGWKSLKSVKIPASVRSIGNYAFSSTNLTNVTCAADLGNGVFGGCKSLTDITLLEGVTTIGQWAFDDCENLKTMYLPASLKDIGFAAFEGCINLTNIHVADLAAFCESTYNFTSALKGPDGPLKLFVGETEVKDLVVPAGVTKITCSLYKFKELTSVTIPSSVTSITTVFPNSLTAVHISDLKAWCNISLSLNINPLFKAYHLFLNGEEVHDLVIPDGVTDIKDYAFYSCESLTSVTLPEGLSSIGKNAFAKCSGMTSVTIPSTVTRCADRAFSDCNNLNAVHINNVAAWCKTSFVAHTSNPLYYAKHLYMNGQEVKALVIPEGVTSIGAFAFDCTEITSVTIPTTLKSMGKYAFNGNTGLTAVHIKDLAAWCQIEYEEGDSYYAANPLMTAKHLYLNGQEVTDLVIPEGVTSINGWTFYFCESLTSINIGNSVTSIGKNAFSNCSNVRTITIGSAVKSIERKNFYDCKELQTVYSLIEEPFDLSNEYQFNIYDETSSTMLFTSATLYVPYGTKAKYEAAKGWKNFKTIIETTYIEPIEGEMTINTTNLGGEDLTDNVVNDVYYNITDGAYDATDGSIIISQPTNIGQISNKEPGSADVKEKFNGMILRVGKGKGIITVNVKTSGNAQLVVQIGNGTPMIASRTERGDVEVSYDVEEDTNVYIYAILGSSNATTRAGADGEVRIYGVKVSPGAVSGITNAKGETTTDSRYYNLGGQRLTKPQKGINIIGGKKVFVP